jgi:hypothetical protein
MVKPISGIFKDSAGCSLLISHHVFLKCCLRLARDDRDTPWSALFKPRCPHHYYQLCEFHGVVEWNNLQKWQTQITYRIFKRFEPDKPVPVGLLLVVIPFLLVPTVHPHAPSLPLAIAGTFVSYYSLIVFYIATYRLSPFHPLAKYPGPIKNKLSKLTSAVAASTGKQHIYYNKLHKQYGDVVRVGKPWLAVHFNVSTDRGPDNCSGCQRSEWSICKLCRCCTSSFRRRRIAERSM